MILNRKAFHLWKCLIKGPLSKTTGRKIISVGLNKLEIAIGTWCWGTICCWERCWWWVMADGWWWWKGWFPDSSTEGCGWFLWLATAAPWWSRVDESTPIWTRAMACWRVLMSIWSTPQVWQPSWFHFVCFFVKLTSHWETCCSFVPYIICLSVSDLEGIFDLTWHPSRSLYLVLSHRLFLELVDRFKNALWRRGPRTPLKWCYVRLIAPTNLDLCVQQWSLMVNAKKWDSSQTWSPQPLEGVGSACPWWWPPRPSVCIVSLLLVKIWHEGSLMNTSLKHVCYANFFTLPFPLLPYGSVAWKFFLQRGLGLAMSGSSESQDFKGWSDVFIWVVPRATTQSKTKQTMRKSTKNHAQIVFLPKNSNFANSTLSNLRLTKHLIKFFSPWQPGNKF